MPALTAANLWLYAAQVALLVGALAAAIAWLRPAPAFRLAACRLVFVGMLVLPFQAAFLPHPAPRSGVSAAGIAPSRFEDAADVRAARRLPWGAIVLGVVVAGAAARGLWLAVGFLRLRRLAHRLIEADAPEDLAELQASVGARARICFAPDVAQPVTFGIAPAIVLLPAALADAPAEHRRPIVCHELLHVRRRDWLWVLAEEAALTALWFHPAAWWLVGEVQLAREEVVDRLTVAATGRRRAYMDALFAAADAPSAPPLLAGFLRRRHLSRRIVSLAEEVVMSRVRLALGGVLMVGVLVGSSAVALSAWPLTPRRTAEQASLTADTLGAVTADVVQIGNRLPVAIPEGVFDAGVGEVIADVSIDVDAQGAVTSARVATITVTGNEHGSASVATTPAIDTMVGGAVDAISAMRFRAPAEGHGVLIVRVRFAAETRAATVTRLYTKSGYPKPVGLRVGGAIHPPQKIVNVQPVYPAEAMEQKVQGVVILDVSLDARGVPEDVQVLRSIPQLDAAAVEAVRQWRYQPTLMNGVPVPVQLTATVNFTLQGEP